MATPKTFTYHVYKNGAFKGLLTNVISDFAFQQEINSAGSTITITLAAVADNYGEGTVVDFNNQIIVYEIDDNNPNGLQIFQGFIVNYQPVFTDTNQEQVILTIMGYGATLNDYMIEANETLDVLQPSQNGSNKLTDGPFKDGSYGVVVQSFTVGGTVTRLSAVELWLSGEFVADVGSSVLVQVLSNQTDAEQGGQSSVIASASMPLTSTTGQAYKFTFASPATVISGNRYWVRIIYVPQAGLGFPAYNGEALVFYDSTKPLSAETFESVQFNGSSWAAPVTITGSAYIKTYQNSGNTLTTYNSYDPSNILKSIIDNYNAQGGKITYTAASIDLTNTTVSYTFNTNTVLDGVNKVLSLAPVGWYWYIDQSTNLIHFHKVSSTSQHKLTLGKNIKNLAVEKRSQDLVNVVYFVGGPTAGTNLFNKYTLQTSVDLYGRHAIVYSDNNVTLAATAQIIANNILSTQGQVELRIGLDIIDDGGDINSIFGFDLESMVLGESISFRSFGPGSGGSLWDTAKWDIAKWDFDITDLSSVIVQVTRLDYTPDILSLTLSTVPPDITKRVQDIYRNLQQANVLLNPATPS